MLAKLDNSCLYKKYSLHLHRKNLLSQGGRLTAAVRRIQRSIQLRATQGWEF